MSPEAIFQEAILQGAIFQEVLRVFNQHPLHEVSRRDLLAALKAGRPGPLGTLYVAGVEVGLPHGRVFTRAAAIYFFFCAANLSDDLSDGDCTYLAEPSRLGPCTQLTLQNLFFHTLLEAELPSQTLSQVIRELIESVGQQHIELRTTQWTAPVFREVAQGIAGRQWSAYLQILWYDTALASRAATIGMNTGIAGHVVKDISTNDPRYTTLPEEDKREIVNWAIESAEALRKENLGCLDAVLRTIDPVLKQAL